MADWRGCKFPFISKLFVAIFCLAIVILWRRFDFVPGCEYHRAINLLFYHTSPAFLIIMIAMVVMYVLEEEWSKVQAIIFLTFGIILFLMFALSMVFHILKSNKDCHEMLQGVVLISLNVTVLVMMVSDLIVTINEPGPQD